MLKTGILVLFALTSTSGAIAQSSESTPQAKVSDAFSLTANGDGPWSIWCDYQDRYGDTKREISPGKDGAGSLAVAHLRGGSCHYTGAKGLLTITITSDAWACPFKVAADAKCEQSLPSFASGSFTLSRRTASAR